jgi:hypothetical protein
VDGGADVPGAGVSLVLADHELGLGGENDLVREAVEIMTPPCTAQTAESDDADWTISAGFGPGSIDSIDEAYADRPVLNLPPRGPRIAVLDAVGHCLEAVGEFRAGAKPSRLSVDGRRHITSVEIADGDVASRRWPDWLARVFFGSRLLASGWMLLHASAVRVADGAILCVAGPTGGKSTFAHRACVEQGAHLMADDLVFIKACGDEVRVVGWPTRIALPIHLAELGKDRLPHAEYAAAAASQGWDRARVILSPAEHRHLLGIPHAGPATLAGTVVLDMSNEMSDAVQVVPLAPSALNETLVAARDIPGQRLYLTDLLGLVGGACLSAGPALVEPVPGPLLKQPAVRLELGDPHQLPRAPIWTPVRDHLPALMTPP